MGVIGLNCLHKYRTLGFDATVTLIVEKGYSRIDQVLRLLLDARNRGAVVATNRLSHLDIKPTNRRTRCRRMSTVPDRSPNCYITDGRYHCAVNRITRRATPVPVFNGIKADMYLIFYIYQAQIQELEEL